MADFNYGLGCLPGKKDIRDYKLKKGLSMGICFPEKFECEKIVPIKNQGQVGSCHDSETKVLTKTGWKYFKDITKEDELASVNPEDNTIIFEHPTDILVYDYSGDMVIGKHKSLDFKVTPNHKMLIRKWDEKKRTLSTTYSFIEAKDLGFYGGFMSEFNYNGIVDCHDDEYVILEAEKLNNGNILPEIRINLHDWVQFIGIYLAEGTLCKTNTSKGTFAYRIQLAAVKSREVNYISDLLGRMGITANKHKKDRFVFSNKRIFKKLESYGLFGIKAKDKFVPDFIFDLDSSYINDFLLGFGMGDGHKYLDNKWQYFTSSSIMAEQLQILALLAGYWNKITVRNPRPAKFKDRVVPIENVLPSYTIATRIKTLSYNRKKDISIENYTGKVYCATMPTYHTLITKRNENILVSGNCVAHSTAEILEYHNKAQAVLSTNFIYGIHNKIFGSEGPGMYLREAAAIARSYGDPELSYCPGNIEVRDVYTKANITFTNQEAMQNAANYKIDSYTSVITPDDIKYSLMNYGPVLGAIMWYSDNACGNDGYLHKGNCEAGGHAIVVLGWNEQGWVCQNSWGKDWGNKGYFILPYTYGLLEAYAFVPQEKQNDVVKPKKNWFTNLIYKLVNWLLNLVA